MTEYKIEWDISGFEETGPCSEKKSDIIAKSVKEREREIQPFGNE